jgi:hypothetical protein
MDTDRAGQVAEVTSRVGCWWCAWMADGTRWGAGRGGGASWDTAERAGVGGSRQ